MIRWFVVAGALYGATGVLLGAFGAHALKSRLSADSLATWETAVLYQLIHAVGLLVIGLFGWVLHENGTSTPAGLGVAGWSWVIGVVLFSGSLYWLALGGPRFLGPLTPLGGMAFVVGWVTLAFSALR